MEVLEVILRLKHANTSVHSILQLSHNIFLLRHAFRAVQDIVQPGTSHSRSVAAHAVSESQIISVESRKEGKNNTKHARIIFQKKKRQKASHCLRFVQKNLKRKKII